MTDRDLYDTILAYGATAVPMHMPGHKRNTDLLGTDLPYAADITEIDGFDNLHAPEENGILSRLAEHCASLYRAKRAFPLVNGSTGGILAAIRALTHDGDTVLIARNVHKSVYHAVELCGLSHVSLLPGTDAKSGILGSISPRAIDSVLSEHPEIRAVVITSPTYEGVVSDVRSIAETVHRHGARLLVDAAHGAHLGFDTAFPAFSREADIVITSLHKTLPALTGTALALLYAEDAALSAALAREIAVFETSSPSYVLLASIDRCISLLERRGAELFRAYAERLRRFYSDAAGLSTLSLLPGNSPAFFGYDCGKLVIRSATMTGSALADRLRTEFRIEPEMAYTDYVLCMTSICDTDDTLSHLGNALRAIDESERNAPLRPSSARVALPEPPIRSVTLRDALSLPVSAWKTGEVSSVYAWVYPPGIPLIVPGEVVSDELLQYVEHLRESGLSVHIGR